LKEIENEKKKQNKMNNHGKNKKKSIVALEESDFDVYEPDDFDLDESNQNHTDNDIGEDVYIQNKNLSESEDYQDPSERSLEIRELKSGRRKYQSSFRESIGKKKLD